MKRRRRTNPELISTIRELKKRARSEGVGLWDALAEGLDKAKRGRVAVNLSRLNRNTVEGEVVAVPGKVLGSGELSHPLTVAAFSFSETARRKISLVDGRSISLKELVDSGIPPSKIKIMG
ncbi:MAG: 50S ribosomal protein L18e [Candidatus Bathyarchaeia archaeon]